MGFLEIMGGGGGGGAVVGYILAFILGIAGSIVVYFMFSRAKKRPLFLYKPRLLLLHDFLNFRKMWTSWFNKVLYLTAACIMNLCILVFMFSSSFFLGLLFLLLGNIFLRNMYELTQVIFSIHDNLNAMGDKYLGRERDDGVSAEQVFAGMGSQLKAKQQELRERSEARRAQEEAEFRRAQEAEARRAREEAEYRRSPQYQQPERPAPPANAPPPPPSAAAPKPAFCPKCGNPFDGSGAFCTKCGNPM